MGKTNKNGSSKSRVYRPPRLPPCVLRCGQWLAGLLVDRQPRPSVLFSGSEQGGVGASSQLPLRARVSRSPLETKPSAGSFSVKLQSSRRRMDPVGVFPASVCRRNAVTGCRLAERKSLRGAFERRKSPLMESQARDWSRTHIRSTPSK